MKCDACGHDNIENAEFCANCGKNIGSKYIPEEYLKDMKRINIKERKKMEIIKPIIIMLMCIQFLFSLFFILSSLDLCWMRNSFLCDHSWVRNIMVILGVETLIFSIKELTSLDRKTVSVKILIILLISDIIGFIIDYA